jgi:C1A family cysteine protease
MRAVLFCVLLGIAVANAAVFKEEEYQFLFTKFMTQYNKKYQHDTFFYRYTVFKQNLDKITLGNRQNHSYTMAMNAMGDMTLAEYKATKLGYKSVDRSFIRSKNVAAKKVNVAALPASVDWAAAGKVTPIKDQGQCGSCWAFSTTGSTEAAVSIAKNAKPVGLSEQQLVDCSQAQGNQGCEGGLMDQAFQYIISNNGIASEASYPYTAEDGTCNTAAKSVATISGFTDVDPNDEPALQAAVAQQPVSVAIEADQACFQFYSGGVLSDPSCGTQLDHGVLAVGYGTDSTGATYWKVKNSWGTSWGVAGYVLIARGTATGSPGECGIAMDPSYPTGGDNVATKVHRKH